MQLSNKILCISFLNPHDENKTMRIYSGNTMAGSSIFSITISLKTKLILTGQVSDILGKQSHLEDVFSNTHH